MDIAELIEIALAGSDERRVELTALEPADIAMSAVSSLAQLITELVDNALEFSAPGDVVRVTGLHEQDAYLISVSDRGVGIPEYLLAELNRVLQDPDRSRTTEPRPGIALVARLASRHGLDVQLVPGAPGTTARVTVPGRLVAEARPPADRGTTGTRLQPRRVPHDDAYPPADMSDHTVDLSRFEHDHRAVSGVIAMSEEARKEAEAFLEKVFAPLVENPGLTERPPAKPADDNGMLDLAVTRDDPMVSHRGGNVTALRMRVPGENFSLVEDDPSTMAAEGAIDIRSALSDYQQGRRSAEDARRQN